MFEIVATEFLIMSMAIWYVPMAIAESHEPWLSLWEEWAWKHKDNDFEDVWYDWNCTNHHPAGWFDEEFVDWLEEQGMDPYSHESYKAIQRLEKYLLKHKYIKRQLYWNHWIYQINKKALYK